MAARAKDRSKMFDKINQVSNTLIADGIKPEDARQQAATHIQALVASAKTLADDLVSEDAATTTTP